MDNVPYGFSSYAAFGEWRSALFDAAYGGGPRRMYEYFKRDVWHSVNSDINDPLVELLTMCDDAIAIPVELTQPLATRLAELAPKLNDTHREWTERVVAGLGGEHAGVTSVSG